MHTARLSRPRLRRRDFPDQGGNGATFQTKAETTRPFRPRWRRRDFSDQGGDGATKIVFLATEVDTVQLSRLSRRRRYPSDQDGDGATFQTKAETARLFRPKRRRSDFPERGGDGETRKKIFAVVVDAARLYQSDWRQPRPRCIWRVTVKEPRINVRF